MTTPSEKAIQLVAHILESRVTSVAGARVALGSHSRASRRIASLPARATTAYVITTSWNSSRLEFLASRTERFVLQRVSVCQKARLKAEPVTQMLR